MAKQEEAKCMFLIESIGECSLIDLKKHILHCSECKDELGETYQQYLYPGKYCLEADEELSLYYFAEFPEKLSKNGFLQAWHLAQSIRGERKEMAYRKMCSEYGVQTMRRVLRVYSIMLSNIGRGASRIFLEPNARLLLARYKELEKLLGKDEFAHWIGDIEAIAKGLNAIVKRTV